MKQGEEYIRGFKFERASIGAASDQEWHGALNAFAESRRVAGAPWPGWMYTAKQVSDEVPRMILLFEYERRGLKTKYKMCAHDPRPAVDLPDNHLRCHLGIECRACPYLQAIESNQQMTNEAKDEAKAWTCATHILLESRADTYFEGFLRDKSDDEFDRNMLRSFAEEQA